jgi:hypothetical protein
LLQYSRSSFRQIYGTVDLELLAEAPNGEIIYIHVGILHAYLPANSRWNLHILTSRDRIW